MKPRTAMIVILILLCFMIFIADLYPDSPFHTDIVITSDYLATIGKGGERRNNLHMGLDCHADNFYPVIFPIMPGIVIEVDEDLIYGKYIIIKHDTENGEIYSLYAHGKMIYYSANGQVTTDTPIMIIGQSGYAGGIHLHLETYRIIRGEKVNADPMEWIGEEWIIEQ